MNTANKFYPARPENYKFDSIILRIKLAYGVLIGKYDALDWGCLQSEKDGDKV